MIPSMGTCRWNVAWAGWANGAMIEERKAETETIAFWRKGWRLSKRYCTSPIRCDKQVARAFGIWLPPRMLSVKFSVLEGMAWNVQLRMLRKWFVAREDGWRGVQQNQNPLREVRQNVKTVLVLPRLPPLKDSGSAELSRCGHFQGLLGYFAAVGVDDPALGPQQLVELCQTDWQIEFLRINPWTSKMKPWMQRENCHGQMLWTCAMLKSVLIQFITRISCVNI